MSRAGIYCRISKDDAGTALGVGRQERMCRELAADRGLEIVDVFVDTDISAHHRKARPGLAALLEAVEPGRIHAVLVYDVDRLYRRPTELEGLVALIERTKAEVLTVAAGTLDLRTASGRLVARLLSDVAQAESERTSERLRARSDDLARAGRPPGGRTPYGYRSPGYTVHEDEARWVRHAADRILDGWSLVRAARELDELGVPTRAGRPWHHSTLRNILVGPAVAGLRVHRREVAGPGEWEPILERDTWERLRVVLADPRRKHTRSGGPYLLSGLVRTPAGDHVNGSVAGHRARAYATKHGATLQVQIHADRLEAAITEAVLLRFDEAALPATDVAGAGEAIDDIEVELQQLADLRGRGVITLAEWLSARAPLQRRLDDARARITPAAGLPELGPSLRAAWPDLTAAQRQSVIGAVIDRIVVRPVGRSKSVPIADRVTVEWKA